MPHNQPDQLRREAQTAMLNTFNTSEREIMAAGLGSDVRQQVFAAVGQTSLAIPDQDAMHQLPTLPSQQPGYSR